MAQTDSRKQRKIQISVEELDDMTVRMREFVNAWEEQEAARLVVQESLDVLSELRELVGLPEREEPEEEEGFPGQLVFEDDLD